MKKGYPFLPFVDSLFGECLLDAWEDSGHSKTELDKILIRIFNKSELDDPGFLFTKNAHKELILSQAPDKIRMYIQNGDIQSLAEILSSIGKGEFENQEYPGADICFELLEWIISGFSDEVNLSELLGSIFSDSRFNEALALGIKKHYSNKFD